MMPERADALSSASPVARALYEELLRAIAPFGEFAIEVKKSSIHLVRSSAFVGAHPRKQYLLVTMTGMLDSQRKNREDGAGVAESVAFGCEGVDRRRFRCGVARVASRDVRDLLSPIFP